MKASWWLDLCICHESGESFGELMQIESWPRSDWEICEWHNALWRSSIWWAQMHLFCRNSWDHQVLDESYLFQLLSGISIVIFLFDSLGSWLVAVFKCWRANCLGRINEFIYYLYAIWPMGSWFISAWRYIIYLDSSRIQQNDNRWSWGLFIIGSLIDAWLTHHVIVPRNDDWIHFVNSNTI